VIAPTDLIKGRMPSVAVSTNRMKPPVVIFREPVYHPSPDRRPG
jgi:predicted transcriptional regulator